MRQLAYILYFWLNTLAFQLVAQNISGKWVGGHNYATKITLDIVQVGDSVYGIGYLVFENKIGRAHVAINGSITDGVLEYETQKNSGTRFGFKLSLMFCVGKRLFENQET